MSEKLFFTCVLINSYRPDVGTFIHVFADSEKEAVAVAKSYCKAIFESRNEPVFFNELSYAFLSSVISSDETRWPIIE